jgi:esterase
MDIKDFHIVTTNTALKAPWLIFLHGLTGSSANWRKITPAFQDRYNILSYDQRGHGKSLKPQTGYAPKDYASDLHFIMRSMGIETANIIGHSMGGRNALSFTNLFPENVLKLVIEDIGPDYSDGNDLAKLLKSVPVPFPSKLKAKEFFLNDLGDPKLGNFLYTQIKENEKREAVWIFDINNILETIEEGQRNPQWNEIKALKCPTLVIRGERSKSLPLETFKKMISTNSHIKGVEIKNSGHWVHFDQPQAFINALNSFLSV